MNYLVSSYMSMLVGSSAFFPAVVACVGISRCSGVSLESFSIGVSVFCFFATGRISLRSSSSCPWGSFLLRRRSFCPGLSSL